jgi:hypothetical protein
MFEKPGEWQSLDAADAVSDHAVSYMLQVENLVFLMASGSVRSSSNRCLPALLICFPATYFSCVCRKPVGVEVVAA